MSKTSGGRKEYRVPGKTVLTVYLDDELVEALRKDMESEDRGLSATMARAVKAYLANKNPETASALRDALDKEGYPAT